MIIDPTTLEAIKQTYSNADWDEADLKGLFAPLHPDNEVAPLLNWAITASKKRGEEQREFKDELRQAHRFWLADKLLGGWPESVTNMVGRYMHHRQITVWFNGLFESALPGESNKTLDLASVGCDLRLAASRVGLPFKARDIDDALSRYKRVSADTRIADVLAQLDGGLGPARSDALERLASAVVDVSAGKGSVRYAARVIETTMWQVLRRLANDPAYPVHDHLMMLLCGPQGAGKTTLVRMLMQPLHDLLLPTNFKHLTDGKDFESLRFPVVFLDEMENAERSDMEAVKNAITRDTMSARVLHTNGNATVRSRNVFIGATNGSLGDKITDTTGLRRFAPIQTKHANKPYNVEAGLSVIEWAALDDIDVIALWRSVDWRGPHPLQSDAEACEEWRAVTEAERNQDSVEAWLRQLSSGDFGGAASVTTGDLYTAAVVGYSDWCDNHGHKGPLANTRFGRRLKAYSSETWYPFLAAKRLASGTVHEFKPFSSGTAGGSTVVDHPTKMDARQRVTGASGMDAFRSALKRQ